MDAKDPFLVSLSSQFNLEDELKESLETSLIQTPEHVNVCDRRAEQVAQE